LIEIVFAAVGKAATVEPGSRGAGPAGEELTGYQPLTGHGRP